MGRYRLGVDTGGTFTDLVMMDEDTGEVRLIKMASTPSDPSVGFLNVTERALRESGVPASQISTIVHGTTVATNTIIEGKGAKTALIATEGFRDVFEIGRQIRSRLYDVFCDKPKPLIPRFLCRGIPERLDFAGRVLRELDEEAVREVVRDLAAQDIDSFAVCLLHAYANPAHENRVREILCEELPDVAVSISSDLCPEMREYYRASTTAINALLVPVVSRYVEQIEGRLAALGVNAGLHLMTSSGGMVSSEIARREPVHLIESGPAAGVIVATHVCRMVGIDDLISFDMGGTTAKVGLVQGGEPSIAPHFEVGAAAVVDDQSAAGYPVRTPVIDLVEIGAGGGSIAWVDPGGAMRVGPRSGGADPGPACYGNGNDQPCITDANLVLGRLNPEYFIGGEQDLHPDLAEKAIQTLADRLGMGLFEAADGIIQIANASMVGAIRLVSVQRGFDPRDFVLVAFGGAGPVHANALARELDIPRVLVPPSPGVTSAMGLLVSDLKHVYVQAMICSLAELDWTAVNSAFRRLETRGRDVLTSEGIEGADVSFQREMDMRYIGQSYELQVSVPSRDLIPDDHDSMASRFYGEHERAYGYSTSTEPCEVVNLRVTAIGSIRQPKWRVLDAGDADASAAIKTQRDVYFPESGSRVSCKIYDRYQLLAGSRIEGPAIVEQIDSTVVIHPDYMADVDGFGNLHISPSLERDS
jgi:N-methylhydantoinase A